MPKVRSSFDNEGFSIESIEALQRATADPLPFKAGEWQGDPPAVQQSADPLPPVERPLSIRLPRQRIRPPSPSQVFDEAVLKKLKMSAHAQA